MWAKTEDEEKMDIKLQKSIEKESTVRKPIDEDRYDDDFDFEDFHKNKDQ